MTTGEIRVHEAEASPTDPNLATDPALWPAHRQAAAIRARELSSRELLDAMVERIERLNPTYNAVVTLDVERGRRLAAAADETIAHGYDHGPLHGLPITVKDALDVAGMRSTGGAAHFADRVPDADAFAVANLVGAGAFCFGKTNVPEWSGDIQTYNDLFGTTNNPWDRARTPGGSSGGAATAVALGMTAFEIGTDIGGSVRIPAAYTGMAGHKPSYGLVPTGGYFDGPDGGLTEPDVNVHGPIARSVDDLDLLLGVLASPAPDRAVAWRVELPPPRHARVGGYRVAVWPDDPACPVSPDTAAAVAHVGDVLATAGCTVDGTARPAIDAAEAALLGSTLVGAAVSPSMTPEEYAAAAQQAHAHDAGSRAGRLAGGYVTSHVDWLAMDRERARIRRAWAAFFEDHDVLLCPVVARPPFLHHQAGSFGTRTIEIAGVERPYRDLTSWAVLVGMAYLPATVVPVGRTADGLPIAVQIVGPYLEDRTTIDVARHVVERIGPILLPPSGA